MKAKIRWHFVTVGLLACIPASLFGQLNWTTYQNNPVIDEDFDPGSIVIQRPSVVYDGSNYHMWYASTREVDVGLVTVHMNYMGYATSPDGINWTLVNPEAIAPTSDQSDFDQFHASQGWVIADGDTFKMWYWGFNAYIGELGLNTIGYARSTDGANWNRVEGPGDLGSVYDLTMAGLPDTSGLATPCVVKDGDTYHMWYSQVVIVPFLFRIGYARSPDGIHWTKVPGNAPEGAVLDWGGTGTFDQYSVAWPAVIRTDEGFMMWYYGYDGGVGRQGCAVSTDGVNWQRVSGGGPKGSCFEDALAVSVITTDDQYSMWYCLGESDVINLAFSQATGIGGFDNGIFPIKCVLGQNYPNPFNPVTNISYSIARRSFVKLTVYDLRGRLVSILANEVKAAGTYTAVFNGKNLTSGVYISKLDVDGYTQMRKMSLIK